MPATLNELTKTREDMQQSMQQSLQESMQSMQSMQSMHSIMQTAFGNMKTVLEKAKSCEESRRLETATPASNGEQQEVVATFLDVCKQHLQVDGQSIAPEIAKAWSLEKWLGSEGALARLSPKLYANTR